MLDETESAVRRKHPPHLGEGSHRLGDGAEPQCADDRVETVRFEGQVFRGSLEDGALDRATAGTGRDEIQPLEQP